MRSIHIPVSCFIAAKQFYTPGISKLRQSKFCHAAQKWKMLAGDFAKHAGKYAGGKFYPSRGS